MSTEANKAIVMQLYEEVLNKGDLDLADKLIAPNAVNHDPAAPLSTTSGALGVKAVVTMLRGAFPDDHHTIEDLIAEGDKVVEAWANRDDLGLMQQLGAIPAMLQNR